MLTGCFTPFLLLSLRRITRQIHARHLERLPDQTSSLVLQNHHQHYAPRSESRRASHWPFVSM